MSKVKSISVTNVKAIASLSADFNGCTAIITGANNSGKTTFLRSLPDRIRGYKPELVLREGETEGRYEMELTTGEKFVWELTTKTKAGERLIFITKENLKTSITKEITAKYFPPVFDVDKFLNSGPKDQRLALQKLVGLDFTDIDARYKEAYDLRTQANTLRDREEILLLDINPIPTKVEAVDVIKLQEEKQQIKLSLDALYNGNVAKNKATREAWESKKTEISDKAQKHNTEQHNIVLKFNDCVSAFEILKSFGYEGSEVSAFLKTIELTIKPTYNAADYFPPEPTYIIEMPDDSEMVAIDQKIADASEINLKAKAHEDYELQKEKKRKSFEDAVDADKKVKEIEKERMDLIKSAKMPEGFGFSDSGITYNGFDFSREQLSSSGIYIAALKLAAINVGEIKTLHFDASFLDKNSLSEIESWANTQGLQLLIERPDFQAGDISYTLISE